MGELAFLAWRASSPRRWGRSFVPARSVAPEPFSALALFGLVAPHVWSEWKPGGTGISGGPFGGPSLLSLFHPRLSRAAGPGLRGRLGRRSGRPGPGRFLSDGLRRLDNIHAPFLTLESLAPFPAWFLRPPLSRRAGSLVVAHRPNIRRPIAAMALFLPLNRLLGARLIPFINLGRAPRRGGRRSGWPCAPSVLARRKLPAGRLQSHPSYPRRDFHDGSYPVGAARVAGRLPWIPGTHEDSEGSILTRYRSFFALSKSLPAAF
jgi:hypothetical protein